MGDKAMDLCECLWGHEFTMRRLLNLLRNSQSYCTDNECYRDDSTPNTNANNQDYALIFSLCMLVVFISHYFRNQTRITSREPSKIVQKDGKNADQDQPPPPPPSSTL